MKTEFKLQVTPTFAGGAYRGQPGSGKLHISEATKNYPASVYMVICNRTNTLADVYIENKDLELIAINILKALKSKHLNTNVK